MNIFYNIELRGGTSNKISLYPNSSLGVDYNLVLPPTAPLNGYFLVWNSASSSLIWSDTTALKSPSTDSPIFTLNDDLGGGDTPTENCGLVVNRGVSTDSQILWDETTDRWIMGLVGSTTNISASYYETFTSADIVSNTLTITHNLGEYPSVTVLDNSNISIGMSATHTSQNEFTLSFTGITVTGTWKIKAIA